MRQFKNIGFIGAGKVGTALAEAVSRHGYRVPAVYSRSHASAAKLANATGQAPFVCDTPQIVADCSDLVFITTPDNAINEVARSIDWHSGQNVVHCSGALTITALRSAIEDGAEASSFHPMQTFATTQTLNGVTIAIEGKGDLVEALTKLANDIGCRAVTVSSEEKSLYHISGVLASNYVVTLMSLAEDLWEAQGLSKSDAHRALITLLKGTVANIEENGIVKALTGPIARGDDTVVAKHLEDLAIKAPALLAVYRGLGQLTVPVAEAKGTIDKATAQRLRALLSGPDDGRKQLPRSERAPKEGLR